MSAARRVRAVLSFAVVVVAIFSDREATAQEDFRSLDADRPLKVTDAYPKKWVSISLS